MDVLGDRAEQVSDNRLYGMYHAKTDDDVIMKRGGLSCVCDDGWVLAHWVDDYHPLWRTSIFGRLLSGEWSTSPLKKDLTNATVRKFVENSSDGTCC